MENVPVLMVRPTLTDLPQHSLPAGYSLRWYRPGDAAIWTAIQSVAEKFEPILATLFQKEFGDNELELARRQAFLLSPHGTEIGTATAWFNAAYRGQSYGRIHWVAIVPEFQGRKLAKPLLSAVCNRLVALGHPRAYLATATGRLPAIQLYLTFGFVPEIRDAAERLLWEKTMALLPGRRPVFPLPVTCE